MRRRISQAHLDLWPSHMLSTSGIVSSQVCHYVGTNALPVSQLLQLERYRGFTPGTKPPADVLQTRRNIHTARQRRRGNAQLLYESVSSGLQRHQKCSVNNHRRSFQSSAQASGLWAWISSVVSKPPEKRITSKTNAKGRRVIEASSLPKHVADSIPRLVEQSLTTYSNWRALEMRQITWFIQDELKLRATLGDNAYAAIREKIISLAMTELNNRRKYEIVNAGGTYLYLRKPDEVAPKSRVVKISVAPDAPKLPVPKKPLLKVTDTCSAAKQDLARNEDQLPSMSPQDQVVREYRKKLTGLRALWPTGSSKTPRSGDLFAAWTYDLAFQRTRSLFAFNPEAHGMILSTLNARIPEEVLQEMTRRRLREFSRELIACEEGLRAVERYRIEVQYHNELYQRDVVSVVRNLESMFAKIYRQGITHDMQVHRKPRAGARVTITNHVLEQSALIVGQLAADLGELSRTLEEKGKLIAAKILDPIERRIGDVEGEYADAKADFAAIRQRYIDSIPERLRSKKDREAEIDLQLYRLKDVREREKRSEELRQLHHDLLDKLRENMEGMYPMLRKLFDEMTDRGLISRLEADKEHSRLGNIFSFDLEKTLDRMLHKIRWRRYDRLLADAGPEILALRPSIAYSDMLDDISGNIEDLEHLGRWATSLILTQETNNQFKLRGIINQLYVLKRDSEEMLRFIRCLHSAGWLCTNSASPLRLSLTFMFRPFYFFVNFWDEIQSRAHRDLLYILSIRLDLGLHRGHSSPANSRESACLDNLRDNYFNIRTSMKQIIIELEDAYWVIAGEFLKRRLDISDNSNNIDLQPFLNTSYAQGRGPLWQRELNALAIVQPQQTLGNSTFQPSPRSAMYPRQSDHKFPVYLLCSAYSISEAVAELRESKAIGVYAQTRIRKKPWDRSSERTVLDILVISTPTRAYLISPDIVENYDGAFMSNGLLEDLAELLEDPTTVKVVDNLYKTREQLNHHFWLTDQRTILGPFSSSVPYENRNLPEPSNKFPENIPALVDRARAPLCWYMEEQHAHPARAIDEGNTQLPDIGPVCIDPESEFGMTLAHGGRQAYSRDDWLYKFSLQLMKRVEGCGQLDQDARRSLVAYYMATTFAEDSETICRVAGVSNASESVADAARKYGLPYHDWHKAQFEDSSVSAVSTPGSAGTQQHQIVGYELPEHELHAPASLTAWSSLRSDLTEHIDDLVHGPTSEIPTFSAYVRDLENRAEYTQIDRNRKMQTGKVMLARNLAYHLQTWRQTFKLRRARPLVKWSEQQERRSTQATRRPSLQRALRGAANKLKQARLKKQTSQDPAHRTPTRGLFDGDGEDRASSLVRAGSPASHRQRSEVAKGIQMKHPTTISNSRPAGHAAALKTTDEGARSGQGRRKSRTFTATKIKKYASTAVTQYKSIALKKNNSTAFRKVDKVRVRKVDAGELSKVDKGSQAGAASATMGWGSYAARTSSEVSTKLKSTLEALSDTRSVPMTGPASVDSQVLPSQGSGKSGAKSTPFAAKADGQSMKKQAKTSSLKITYQSSDPLPTAGAKKAASQISQNQGAGSAAGKTQKKRTPPKLPKDRTPPKLPKKPPPTGKVDSTQPFRGSKSVDLRDKFPTE
jgi:hypothetical protein